MILKTLDFASSQNDLNSAIIVMCLCLQLSSLNLLQSTSYLEYTILKKSKKLI